MTCTHLISSDQGECLKHISCMSVDVRRMSVVCRMSCFPIARISGGQASTPSGTVSTGTPLGAELSFRRPDTVRDTENHPFPSFLCHSHASASYMSHSYRRYSNL